MKKIFKNKSGFTLVELLAVIVILALIMAIAVSSMSGVMDSSRRKTLLSNAATIISAVRTEALLYSTMTNTTYYYFTDGVLESGGKTSPLGGTFTYYSGSGAVGSITPTASGLGDKSKKVFETSTAPTCSASATSFVTATKDASGNFEWKICLTAGTGNPYVNATESVILANDTDNAIVTS